MTDSQTQQIELSSDISTNDNVTSTKKVTGTAPDVVLLCEGERISCHRAVLAKASSYFSAMFSSSFAEKDERSITIKVCRSNNMPFQYRLSITIIFV
jgi:uncharacterized protein YfiM (DUF2279 family)